LPVVIVPASADLILSFSALKGGEDRGDVGFGEVRFDPRYVRAGSNHLIALPVFPVFANSMSTEIICIVYHNDVIDKVLLVSSDTAPTRNIGLLLHDVARLFRRRFDEVARSRQLGFTRAQASVLIHLSRNQGINQVSLAQLMELEPITLVRLLDRLQAAGLVERRADPLDRRARNLFLTDAAPAMLARIEILATEIRRDAMAGLDGEDAERLIFILQAMKLNLLEQSADDSGKTAPGPQNIQVANA